MLRFAAANEPTGYMAVYIYIYIFICPHSCYPIYPLLSFCLSFFVSCSLRDIYFLPNNHWGASLLAQPCGSENTLLISQDAPKHTLTYSANPLLYRAFLSSDPPWSSLDLLARLDLKCPSRPRLSHSIPERTFVETIHSQFSSAMVMSWLWQTFCQKRIFSILWWSWFYSSWCGRLTHVRR